MGVLEAIKNRREITSFTDETIPSNILEDIVDAGYYAPSGNNLLSREFIVVTKRDVLDELEKTTSFMPWLKEATAAIVVTGRPDVSKYWIQDASIAAGYIWLRASEQGLGVGFGAVHHTQDKEESDKRESWVQKVLNIPEDRTILTILGLGYPKVNAEPKKHNKREDVVFYKNFK